MTDRHHRLRAELQRQLPDAIALRRALHAEPRRSGDEADTRDTVLAALPGGGRGAEKTADTGAVLRIGGPGPAVAVRGEMDALEIAENTGVPWASRHPGLMHACGHDVHLAAVAALARAVDAAGGPAPLLVLLQPREETYPSGARDIAESGVMEREQARAAIGAHVQPALPAGTVACVPGPVNASSDEFTVTVHGRGGHAAYPHRTADPVVALAQVVVALQTLVSREADPMRAVVLSTTVLAAGAAANVVPDAATARGTVRAMRTEDRRRTLARLAETADLVARAHGCTAAVRIEDGEPVLDNDPALAAAAGERLEGFGATVDRTLRSAGSDDFSFYSERLPSLMMFVGTDAGADRLHAPTFLPDDAAVPATAHALLAGYLAAAGMA